MLYPFEFEPVLVRKPPTLFGNMLYFNGRTEFIERNLETVERDDHREAFWQAFDAFVGDRIVKA